MLMLVERFNVQRATLFAHEQSKTWIIKGVLPAADLAVMYGASGSGKSFVALDMAVHIAQGKPWRGRRTAQGRVVYIAAEGGQGFRKRLAAYSKHHGIDLTQLPLGVIQGAPSLLDQDDVVDLATSIVQWGKADLIVIDTLAQCMIGGNENGAEDVSQALANCRRISEITGALVLLIHHSGKDRSKGARGWSGMRAAADAEIEITRTNNQRAMQLTKSKDAEDNLKWHFELLVVPIGTDEDGDVIDSCVVIESEQIAASNTKLGEVAQIILKTLLTSGPQETESLVSTVSQSRPEPAPGKRDQRKSNTRRIIHQLIKKKLLSLENGLLEAVKA